jgi:hypothetical protein
MNDTDPMLDLDALLDPARLAAAWQVARDRPLAAAAAAAAPVPEPRAVWTGASGDAGTVDPDDAAHEPAPAGESEPARAAPLAVALAHRQFLDEIERSLAASPGLAARARRVLTVPLAQLARAIDPVDLAATEVALDLLEDVLQALLSEAGWPESPGSPGNQEE